MTCCRFLSSKCELMGSCDIGRQKPAETLKTSECLMQNRCVTMCDKYLANLCHGYGLVTGTQTGTRTCGYPDHLPVSFTSPYKGRLLRKPQHRPQVTSRGEQVNAAEAFVPQPNFVQPKIPSQLALVAARLPDLTVTAFTVSVGTAAAIDGDPLTSHDE